MKVLNYLTSVAMSVALTAAFNANAGESPNSFLPVLSTVTSAELPAKAAELVSHAKAKTIRQTTVDVVKTAVGLNPAAAMIIVSSIARTSPKMAATAAGTAVALVPDQSASIARAAVAAAPSEAAEIVEAICRVVPADYQQVADAAAEIVPGAGKEILAAVSKAVPQLKNSIAKILTDYNGKIPSVSDALNTVATANNPIVAMATGGSSPLLNDSGVRGPSSQSSLVPLSNTSHNINPGSGGQKTGSRGYASP